MRLRKRLVVYLGILTYFGFVLICAFIAFSIMFL